MTSKLSDAQKKVANDFEGPSMVIACPGSGKTFTILKRVMNLLSAGVAGRDGNRILIVTFTRAAADDLQRRLYNELGILEHYKLCLGNDPCINIMTLHGLCLKIIEHDWRSEEVIVEGSIEQFIVEGLEQKIFFTKEIKNRYHLTETEAEKKAVEMISSLSKTRNLQEPLSDLDAETCKVYKAYRAYKLGWLRKTRQVNKAHKIDYDDFLVKAGALLKKESHGERYWGNKYQYIMVDEFQDVNKMQLDILFELARSRNICVVGDDDQSIYKFRGSNHNVFEDFKKHYTEYKEYHLDVNYRSVPDIIEAAGKLITHNTMRIPKSFNAFQKQGGTTGVIRCDCNPAEMPNKIVERIETLKLVHDTFYKKSAVLFRQNRQGLAVAATFLIRGIPFKYIGNMPNIYGEMFCQDIKTYYELTQDLDLDKLFQILNHPNRYLDAADFRACMPCKESFINALRMCGKYADERLDAKIRSVEALFKTIEALKGLPPELFVKKVLTKRYEKWILAKTGSDGKNYHILKQYVEMKAREHMDMASWLDTWKNFVADLEDTGENQDAVVLSTFHSSKGLEWDEVHIIDANDGIAPLGTAKSKAELEEERRLFYVAMTRAKKRVTFYVTGKPSVYMEEMGLGSILDQEL